MYEVDIMATSCKLLHLTVKPKQYDSSWIGEQILIRVVEYTAMHCKLLH